MRIRQVSRATLSLLFLCVSAGAQTIDPFYSGSYSITGLALAGVPSDYGGLIFKAGAPNTLIIGGEAAEASGRFYEVPVVRGAGNHIVGLGTPVMRGFGAYNDGGIAYGPGGVLFYSQFGPNAVAQVKPGSNADDKVVALGPLGIAYSTGGLNFVPAGYNGAGQLKVSSWNDGEFYTVTLAADGSGTYNLTGATQVATLSGGPEAFAYVPLGSPLFGSQSMLVAEFSAGSVAAYTIDANGNPVPGSRRTFIAGLDSAEGVAIDPLTGDFLLTSCGCSGANRIIAARGFTLPGGAETGWWWNESESGRGFFIEQKGSTIVMAGYIYDDAGNPIWFLASGAIINNVFTAEMQTYRNGQTLTGPYVGPATGPPLGTITVRFTNAVQATVTWPGGTFSIDRFTFGAGGPGLPENGWWWSSSESGRGFSIEVKGNTLVMAGYMYSVAGPPIWYLSSGTMTSSSTYTGSLQQYAMGQSIGSPYHPPQLVNANVGTVSLVFTDTKNGTITLPDGRQVAITRFAF